MKFKEPKSLEEISELIGAEIIGESKLPVTGINEIHKVQTGDITFVDHPKYYKRSIQSAATFIIIDDEMEKPEDTVLLVVDDPFEAYSLLVDTYFPFVASTQMIDAKAIIDETAVIQPGVFMGPNVSVGADTIIQSGVVIQGHAQIGDRCVIHGNSVIGSDAFYYHFEGDDDAKYTKMPSCGRVIIDDDVEIGAACTIDRGVSGDTIIGKGTKIDNSVHVGHGVEIGMNCIIAAQVGIAGKTIIKDEVKLWGQVGVSKSLVIGPGAEVYAQSGVPSSIEGGKKYFGSPVGEAKEKMKELVWLKRIEELSENVEELKKKFDI